MLSPSERERVEAAVAQAEMRTAGEIVVVLARQAASYRSVPLGAALAAALLTPWPLLWLTSLSTTRIFLVQLAVALAVLVSAVPTSVRMALLPQAIRRRRGREAAERVFVSRGLALTGGRTGVLLYVAERERHAEVIGDLAIAARVDETEWREIVASLVEAAGRGALADGLVGAIGQIGAILARVAPADSDNADELPNKVVVL